MLPIMIRGWKYDDGEPIWSDTIGDYIGEPSQPRWHCVVPKRNSTEIEIWLNSNLDERAFDYTFRYNSGDPAMFLDIYDKDAAALFYMTWVESIY